MHGRMDDLTGMTVIGESGSQYKLSKFIGSGAQGVVYEEASEKYVIKLYFPSDSEILDADVLERIRFIKSIQMPKNFVSVLDVIGSPYIGYVMEKVVNHKPLNSYLIPDKNIAFHEWYNQGLGLYERLIVGYIISKAFGELEKSNLSYCDISGNNILIKIAKGASVKMIDIDNVYIAGKGKSAILGTPRYIAPEIISRQKNPDVLSDNYSLAVILFELLRSGHPYISDDILDGTPECEENALAGNAEYVNAGNSTNMLPADVVFTSKLNKLFRQCFVDGKKNRLCRPSAREFEYALLEASNLIVKCPTCGAWHYFRKKGKVSEDCPWCDSQTNSVAWMKFYDVLCDGSDYKTISDENIKNGKLVFSYVLKKNQKNYIKNLYVLRYDNPSKEQFFTDNYLTIAHNEEGFYVYNEFSKTGIVVKRYKTKKFEPVDNKKALLLNSGDEIFFEINGGAIGIECGGENYSFIRVARFKEERE